MRPAIGVRFALAQRPAQAEARCRAVPSRLAISQVAVNI